MLNQILIYELALKSNLRLQKYDGVTDYWALKKEQTRWRRRSGLESGNDDARGGGHVTLRGHAVAQLLFAAEEEGPFVVVHAGSRLLAGDRPGLASGFNYESLINLQPCL